MSPPDTLVVMAGTCCDSMAGHLAWSCDMHDDPYDCPDAVVVRDAKGRYGVPVHDGGRSYIAIGFCPWCGQALAKR
jgi:hypothetical protein